MKKDVMIFIKGTQEVDGEKDTIELMTKGRYYKRRDVLYLSYEEMDELIKELLTLENPYNCPHGRPTIISMSKYELEKKFKRIV